MLIYLQYKLQIAFNLKKLQANENISIDDITSNLSHEELDGNILSNRLDLTRAILESKLPIMNLGIIAAKNSQLLEPPEEDNNTPNPGDNTH